MLHDEVKRAIRAFKIPGELIALHPFKVGHINETFVSVWLHQGQERHYLHQQVNNYVFRDIAGLMRNVLQVTSQIRDRAPNQPDATLSIIPTLEGRPYYQDPEGQNWRTYKYIEQSVTFEICPDAQHAFEAARTVGQFLYYLADLSPRDFCETIPMFHHFPNRFRLLREVLTQDVEHRKVGAEAEIGFALQRDRIAGTIISKLEAKELPLRVTHNDLKLNNVLFHQQTQRGICVVDLDTCMPGSALYDFGDLVRSVGVSAKEDETELEKITLNLDYFTALTQGYLESTRAVLQRSEVELMHLAPRLLALALGVRFLTDHLAGDVYFKIHHRNHNLERARAQFRVVAEMERLEPEMKSVVQRCWGGRSLEPKY